MDLRWKRIKYVGTIKLKADIGLQSVYSMPIRDYLSSLPVWRQLISNLIAVTKSDTDTKTFPTALLRTQRSPKVAVAPGTFAD